MICILQSIMWFHALISFWMSTITKKVWTFLHIFVSHFCFVLAKFLVISVNHLFIVFFLLSYRNPLYIWDKIFVDNMCCNYLLPVYGFSFYSLNGVFWWTKVLNLNVVGSLFFIILCFKKSFPIISYKDIIQYYLLRVWLYCFPIR